MAPQRFIEGIRCRFVRHREQIDSDHPNIVHRANGNQRRRQFGSDLQRRARVPAKGRHHQQLHNAAHGRAFDIPGVQPRLVQQHVLEPGHPGPIPDRRREQVRKLRRVLPSAASLIEHQRHDRQQLRTPGVVAQVCIPDATAVLHQPEPHPRIRCRLMLEQQVKPQLVLPHPMAVRVLAVASLEKQVGFALAQVIIHEASLHQPQAVPIDVIAQLLRHGRLEQAGGFRGVGEDRTKQPVVRVIDFICHE